MPLPVSGCPYCGKLMWVKDEAIEWLDPQTIRFPCPHCHALVRRMLALYPTLSEYVLKMPRGAQVLYPKDLGVIIQWADIYPGAHVFEAGTGSGALTMALLRAVGDRGHVVSYEAREDFARTAMKNIERYLGPVPNLTVRQRNAYEGIEEGALDRVILDLPEPWQVVPHAATALRSGGIYLSYV